MLSLLFWSLVYRSRGSFVRSIKEKMKFHKDHHTSLHNGGQQHVRMVMRGVLEVELKALVAKYCFTTDKRTCKVVLLTHIMWHMHRLQREREISAQREIWLYICRFFVNVANAPPVCWIANLSVRREQQGLTHYFRKHGGCLMGTCRQIGGVSLVKHQSEPKNTFCVC